MIYETPKFQSEPPERPNLESEFRPGSRPAWTRSSVDTPVVATDGGTPFLHPFKISVELVASVWNYSLWTGSIIDGTNGANEAAAAIASSNAISETRYVFIVHDVVADSWYVEDTTSSDGDEVIFDTSSPYDQTYARLFIGKIEFVDGVPYPLQACFTSQIYTHGLVNGKEARVFESAPTLPSAL